ncbi:WhiB family transcriptional regulator [Streptomyces sp. NPDC050211]|uniref:WhiB family transcriptional regulator n=1 Tax=Streptomyces sp. NPDC050211 TaxID=3154932 RepID=UPI00344298F0
MDRDWELQAACRTEDPDIFFSSRSIGLARQTCRGCPVRMECLESALIREAGVAKAFRTGIVAALSGAQRWAIEQQRKAAQAAEADAKQPEKKQTGRPKGSGLAPCGTPSAYQRHVRNNEPIDAACKAANAASRREYRRTGSTKVPASR